MSVKPLNHYSLENPASIYDEEAMTALELAGRTAAKTNEVVEAFNNLEKETNDHLAEQDKTIGTRMDDQDESIRVMNEETMPEKVTAEVQRKIDSGEFDEAINDYAGDLEGRVDNLLGSVKAGSTTMDAEIIDARYGADGKTYDNLGEANRSQMNNKANVSVENAGFYLGTAGKPYKIEWAHLAEDKLVLTIPGTLVFRAKDNIGRVEWADISSELGDAIEYDGNNATITIEGYNKKLVYNFSDKLLHIRHVSQLYPDDLVLMVNGYGTPCGGALMRHIDTLGLSELCASTIAQASAVYVAPAGSDSPITWEKTGESGLTIHIPNQLVFRFRNFNGDSLDWAEYGSELPTSIMTINDKQASITIPGYGCRLVFNVTDKKYYIRYTTSQPNGDDIVLMVNGYGTPCGGALMRYIYNARFASIEKRLPATVDGEETTTKIANFAALFNNKVNVETFMFFTDPHLTQFTGNEWRSEFDKYMSFMGGVYGEAPVSRVFCGGDWLGHGELPEEACYRLGLIDSTMRRYFNQYHHILGNHDTNYQGKATAESETWTGTITNNTINNLLYRCEGKAYYKVNGEKTDFYVFDTQTENQSIGVYENEQCKWFAQSLSENARENIALMMHIVYYNEALNIQPISGMILGIAQAFNNRSTIDIDGVTYNFNNATGKVRYCMSGHLHIDGHYTENGIPIIITTHARDGSKPTFDLCLTDYDNNTLHLVRIGTGSDRIISI